MAPVALWLRFLRGSLHLMKSAKRDKTSSQRAFSSFLFDINYGSHVYRIQISMGNVIRRIIRFSMVISGLINFTLPIAFL